MTKEEKQKFVDELQSKAKEHVLEAKKNEGNIHSYSYFMGVASSLQFVAKAFAEAMQDKKI